MASLSKCDVDWVHPDPKRRKAWNPLIGCGNGNLTGPDGQPICVLGDDCWARKIVRRNLPGLRWAGTDFAPTFNPDLLDRPAELKTPSGIFACNMSDLFGPWHWKCAGYPRMSYEVRMRVARAMVGALQHVYFVLTRHPGDAWFWLRQETGGFRRELVSRLCLGTSVNVKADLYRLKELCNGWEGEPFVDRPLLSVSIEPLMEGLGDIDFPENLDWVIVGGWSGGRPPRGQYFRDTDLCSLVTQVAERGNLSCFVKPNVGDVESFWLNWYWGHPERRWPAPLVERWKADGTWPEGDD